MLDVRHGLPAQRCIVDFHRSEDCMIYCNRIIFRNSAKDVPVRIREAIVAIEAGKPSVRGPVVQVTERQPKGRNPEDISCNPV